MPGVTTRINAPKPASGDALNTGAGHTAAGLDAIDEIVVIYRGAWDSATTYAANDVVKDDDATFIAIAPSTNHEPPNDTYWDPWGGGGTVGASTPVSIDTDGVPYFDPLVTGTAELLLDTDDVPYFEVV